MGLKKTYCSKQFVIVNRRVLDHIDISMICYIWLLIRVSTRFVFYIRCIHRWAVFRSLDVIFIPACGHLGEEKGAFLIPVPPKKWNQKTEINNVMLCLHVLCLTFCCDYNSKAVFKSLTFLVGGFFFFNFHPYLRVRFPS